MEKIKKRACWFCWMFNRKWKDNNELVVGYVLFWDIYPNTVKRAICWKCCVLWQQTLKDEWGANDMNWLGKFKENDRKLRTIN